MKKETEDSHWVIYWEEKHFKSAMEIIIVVLATECVSNNDSNGTINDNDEHWSQ